MGIRNFIFIDSVGQLTGLSFTTLFCDVFLFLELTSRLKGYTNY